MKLFFRGVLFCFLLFYSSQAFAAMTSGTVTVGSIVAGGTSTQTFSGTSGDGVQLSIADSYSTTTMKVYKPDGTLWTTSTSTRQALTPLPATGTYNVVISAGATDAGSYNMYYVEGGKGTSGGSLTSGSTAIGTMPTNGLISYAFTGTAGQGIQISFASSYSGTIYVYNPDGSYNTFSSSSRFASLGPYTLLTTGTYTIVYQAAGLTDTGSYSLYYVRGAGAVSSGALTSGMTKTGSLALNQMASYTITTTAANQAMQLNFAASYLGYIFIYNPDGTFNTSSNTNRLPASPPLTLATAGTYTIVVEAYTDTDTGSYTLYYTLAASTVSSGALPYGSTKTGTLALNQLVSYTLAGVSGQPLVLTSTSSYTPDVFLYNPDGSYKTTSNTGTLTVNPLTVTGTYTVLFEAYTGTDTGNYTLNFSGTLSNAGKTDGKHCVRCDTTVQTAAKGNVGTDNGNISTNSDATASALNGYTGGAGGGDPINFATGNLYESVTDYTTQGPNPLALIRSYNSMSVNRTNLIATLMGVNWRTNYDRYLFVSGSGTSVVAQRPDGQMVNFYLIGGVWTPDADTDYTLTNVSTTYTLTDGDDTVETYTSSGTKGTLNTIKLRDGYIQTMNYTSGRLTSVSDTYGRTLTFTNPSGLITGLTTPDGLNLTYNYTTVSTQSLLTSVAYNTSPVTTLTYLYGNASFPYALTGITDENGHRYASWAYDASGRATSSSLGGPSLNANLTTVSYDDVTGNRTVTGPLGIQNTYKFSTLQNEPKVIEIDRAANGTVAAANEKFQYDANGYMQSLTDWNGINTWFTNNSHGMPTAIVFASGSTVSHTTTISYDTTWTKLAHIITEPGLTTTLNYATGNGTLLTKVAVDTTSQVIPYSTNGQSRTWTMTYTATGQRTSLQLPRTDVTAKTTYTWTGGVMTGITNALGQHPLTVATYKAGGLPLTVYDQNHTLTTYAYSTRLWRTSAVMTTSAGNLTSSAQFDSAGELTKTTLPDNSYLKNAYDNAHRLITVTNALSETKNITFNSAGGMTQELWKTSGGTTKRQHTATFDAMNRMLTSVGGASQTTTYGYNSNSNVTKITDPLSHVTTNTYDALNRLSTSKDAELNLVTTTYDAHDRVLTVKDGKNNTTTYIYDGFGDRISQVSPDSGTSVFWFNPDSDVTKQSAFAVTNYTYDALDRLLTRTYPTDSTLNVSQTYDQSGHGSGVGHLTSVTDQAGSLSLSYDQRGLTTANNRTISSQAYNTGYSYESAGRLATITYASAGWKLTYVRDSAGQVTSVTDKPPTSGAVNLATSVTHLPFGPVASLTYGNGVTDARTYDLDYRMTSVKDTATSNIQYNSYGYDADNNVHTITDNVTSANNQTLTYNRIDALKSATGVYGTISSITYDSNSNRLTYGSTTYTVPSGSDKMSAVGASSITYSSTGNITGIGTTPTFTWNKANQMATGILSGTTSTYLYDYAGRRLKVTVGTGVPSVTEYDRSGHVIFENNTRVETDYAYMDGMPIAAIQPVAATVSALHTDQIGTVLRATNAAKTVVFTANYDPNGATTPTTTITQNNRLPYNYNDATGLYHNGVRDNNPNFALGGGRYPEVDPIGLAGGINPYIYAGNNAYKWTDRLGLQEDSESPSGNILNRRNHL